ncbi:MAG: hypothetical protein Kow00106_06750 [Anaerolineae bacterium]
MSWWKYGVMFLLALATMLTGCTERKTALRFTNATQCGTATIRLTDTETGFLQEYSLGEGGTLEIELKPNVQYRYEVEYPRQPDYIVCDAKRVTTMLPKGQTLNVRLESVLDPALVEATQTAAAAQ